MSRIVRYAIVLAWLGAVPAVTISTVALANQCAAQCYAQENACRRATKDSPRCGAELTRCLQSCRAQR